MHPYRRRRRATSFTTSALRSAWVADLRVEHKPCASTLTTISRWPALSSPPISMRPPRTSDSFAIKHEVEQNLIAALHRRHLDDPVQLDPLVLADQPRSPHAPRAWRPLHQTRPRPRRPDGRIELACRYPCAVREHLRTAHASWDRFRPPAARSSVVQRPDRRDTGQVVAQSNTAGWQSRPGWRHRNPLVISRCSGAHGRAGKADNPAIPRMSGLFMTISTPTKHPARPTAGRTCRSTAYTTPDGVPSPTARAASRRRGSLSPRAE